MNTAATAGSSRANVTRSFLLSVSGQTRGSSSFRIALSSRRTSPRSGLRLLIIDVSRWPPQSPAAPHAPRHPARRAALRVPRRARATRRARRAVPRPPRRAELPLIRIHDLRHTCASLLLVQGVHPRIVMETLGHSQISLTMDTYSHVLPALQQEAARQIDSLLNAKS